MGRSIFGDIRRATSTVEHLDNAALEPANITMTVSHAIAMEAGRLAALIWHGPVPQSLVRLDLLAEGLFIIADVARFVPCGAASVAPAVLIANLGSKDNGVASSLVQNWCSKSVWRSFVVRGIFFKKPATSFTPLAILACVRAYALEQPRMFRNIATSSL